MMSSAPYRNLDEDHISVDSAGSQGSQGKSHFSDQGMDGTKNYKVEVVGMEELSSSRKHSKGVAGLKFSRGCLAFILIFVAVAVLLIILVAIVSNSSPKAESGDDSFPWKSKRLPTDIFPMEYNIFLNPDLEKRTVTGQVTVSISAKSATNFIVIHAKDMNLTDPQLTDSTSKEEIPISKEIKMSKKLGAAYISLDKEMERDKGYDLQISFSYELKEGLDGFYISSYKQDNVTKWIGSTQMEPVDARKAFPCFDEPQLKANFSLQMVHRREQSVLFNTPLKTSTRYEDSSDLLLDTFETTVSMSTYLVAFVIADFVSISNTTAKGTEVSVYSRNEFKDQMDLALDAAMKTIPFYEKYFDIDYPLPKQDMVAIPNFAAGAMENWGLILYRETALLYKEGVTKSKSQQWVVIVITHELAHQWFGNLVTMKWWNDLWLNEGFASYMEYVGSDNFNPSWKMMDQFILETTQVALGSDSLSDSHPISVPVHDPDDINALFDSITYSKGASIIRMLSDFLSREVFKKGLQIYLKRHAYQNAVTADLWEALSNASRQVKGSKGVNVSDLMDYWTLQMGFPLVTFNRTGQKLVITQEHFLINPKGKPSEESPFNYKWMIPLKYTYMTTGSEPVPASRLISPNVGGTTISLKPDTVWVKGNTDQSGFYRMNYDTETWRALIEALKSKTLPPAERASLIDDAFHVFRAGKLDMEIPFSMIESLKDERDYVPFSTALINLRYIRKVLIFRKGYLNFVTYMKRILQPVFMNLTLSDTGDHLNKLMQAEVLNFLLDIDHAETLEWAEEKYSAYMQTGNVSVVGADLSPIMRCGGVMRGQEAEWDFAWEKFKSNKIASENRVFLYVLSCTRNPTILIRYLYESLSKETIRTQDTISVIAYVFKNPVGTNIALNFVIENWDTLIELFGGSTFALHKLIPSMTTWISTPIQAQQVRSFLESKIEQSKTGQRPIKQAYESMDYNVQFLQKHEANMERWFKEALRKT